MNLVCLKHPEYNGTSSPQLACQNCCTIFIAVEKSKTGTPVDEPFNAKAWLDEKARQAKERP